MERRLLIVEDDCLLTEAAADYFAGKGWRVETAEDGAEALELLRRKSYHLILLDVNLPGVSGFDVCTQIREQMQIPIIFLTSRTDSMDELNGILKGGDDYITKPYQAPILLARIGAVLKRTGGGESRESARMVCREVELDLSACRLSYRGRTAELTKHEMKILHRLFQDQGKFVARMDLIEHLWENQMFIDDNTLSVHISRLREKLASVGVRDFIETRRGMGYRV